MKGHEGILSVPRGVGGRHLCILVVVHHCLSSESLHGGGGRRPLLLWSSVITTMSCCHPSPSSLLCRHPPLLWSSVIAAMSCCRLSPSSLLCCHLAIAVCGCHHQMWQRARWCGSGWQVYSSHWVVAIRRRKRGLVEPMI